MQEIKCVVGRPTNTEFPRQESYNKHVLESKSGAASHEDDHCRLRSSLCEKEVALEQASVGKASAAAPAVAVQQ